MGTVLLLTVPQAQQITKEKWGRTDPTRASVLQLCSTVLRRQPANKSRESHPACVLYGFESRVSA